MGYRAARNRHKADFCRPCPVDNGPGAVRITRASDIYPVVGRGSLCSKDVWMRQLQHGAFQGVASMPQFPLLFRLAKAIPVVRIVLTLKISTWPQQPIHRRKPRSTRQRRLPFKRPSRRTDGG